MSDYLDDSVDLKLRAELEVHVSQCPNCFVVVDTTKRTLQIYKGMEAQDVPSGVKNRLMAALDKRMAAKREKCSGAPVADQGSSTGQAPR
ncbi:MAG: zf-HC2 domain-containing protein [Bryobacteraceae bacterium]